MNGRRVGLGLAALAIVVVAAYWVAVTERQEPLVGSQNKLATASSVRVAPSKVKSIDKRAVDRVDSEAAPASIFRKPIHVVAVDGTAAVPRRYQFAGVARVQTGENFEDWMSRFSAVDQQVLRAFDRRHYGVYRGRSPLQIAWMAANGYPMPEDILAAQLMSSVDLRNMAKHGSIKAAFLLKDRELTKIAQIMKAQDKDYGEVLEGNPQLSVASRLFGKEIIASESPYKAFLLAQDEALTYEGLQASVDSVVIGALTWAEALGDDGARHRISAFVKASASPEERKRRQNLMSGALSFYAYVQRSQGAQRPNVDCLKLVSREDPYPYTPPDTDH